MPKNQHVTLMQKDNDKLDFEKSMEMCYDECFVVEMEVLDFGSNSEKVVRSNFRWKAKRTAFWWFVRDSAA